MSIQEESQGSKKKENYTQAHQKANQLTFFLIFILHFRKNAKLVSVVGIIYKSLNVV
jgi:hypothetical protein